MLRLETRVARLRKAVPTVQNDALEMVSTLSIDFFLETVPTQASDEVELYRGHRGAARLSLLPLPNSRNRPTNS